MNKQIAATVIGAISGAMYFAFAVHMLTNTLL